MAEIPSHQPISPPSTTTDPPSQYWCYHCDKRVSVETLTDLPDIICFECKNGFVESISFTAPLPLPPQPLPSSNRNQEHSFSNQFLQILRLIAEAARDEDNPPPPPPHPHLPSSDPGDFLRIELNGWNNNEVNDEEEEDDEDETDIHNNNNNDVDVEIGGNQDQEIEDVRRRRRDLLRLRIRDFATRATSNRNRILDWSEILMGLDDHTMEFRVEMPEWDGYVGNPEDYVDAAGYEALLQNLAESDGGRGGAPPASKAAVAGLRAHKITQEEGCLGCAICKDVVGVGEMAKKLPCGHGYHGDCIVTWLGTRNTCPICRYELPTEDADYEEQRRLKRSGNGSTSSSSSAHDAAGV